jgi:hypothetical protein
MAFALADAIFYLNPGLLLTQQFFVFEVSIKYLPVGGKTAAPPFNK